MVVASQSNGPGSPCLPFITDSEMTCNTVLITGDGLQEPRGLWFGMKEQFEYSLHKIHASTAVEMLVYIVQASVHRCIRAYQAASLRPSA
jgi:hypothetical protein